ncbi:MULTISPECIES: hypothetical protein [Enterococcus]|uniref:hypothetical protein n=1 Tax=Enterococcus TaxID=1350 RepID=UPI002892505E|nr:hypothetical protein [Enterococcus thailandicus]MDT2750996.1 hypothetical protein [Enterococcus thailandicus]MDT2775677.1 hypothetical protein [Enterococcus thailandicus]
MKQNEIPVKMIMGELGIKNKTQIETWQRWLTFVFLGMYFYKKVVFKNIAELEVLEYLKKSVVIESSDPF